MYFGEYLISKKKITNGQLIDALAKQVEEMPSLLRMLKSANVLKDDVIVDLIGEQARKETDLLAIIREKKVLTSDQINNLFKAQAENRRPLGMILVADGVLSEAEVNVLVDEYLTIDTNAKAKPMASAPSGSSKISAAALESLKELGMAGEFDGENISTDIGTVCEKVTPADGCSFDFSKKLPEVFVGQFLNAFNENEKNKLKKIVDMMISIAQNGDDVANVVNSLYREVHIVMGASKLAEISVTKELVTALDVLVAKLFAVKQADLCCWVGDYIHHVIEAVEVLWLIRTSLVTDGSEKNFWANESFKARYISVKNELDKLNKK